MFQSIKKRARFGYALKQLETRADIEAHKTTLYKELRWMFYALNDKSSFSFEASTAMTIVILMTLVTREIARLQEEGVHPPMYLVLTFTKVPEVLSTMASVFTMKAPDGELYESVLGFALKHEFNAAWKILQDQAEEREQRQRQAVG